MAPPTNQVRLDTQLGIPWRVYEAESVQATRAHFVICEEPQTCEGENKNRPQESQDFKLSKATKRASRPDGLAPTCVCVLKVKNIFQQF